MAWEGRMHIWCGLHSYCCMQLLIADQPDKARVLWTQACCSQCDPITHSNCKEANPHITSSSLSP